MDRFWNRKSDVECFEKWMAKIQKSSYLSKKCKIGLKLCPGQCYCSNLKHKEGYNCHASLSCSIIFSLLKYFTYIENTVLISSIYIYFSLFGCWWMNPRKIGEDSEKVLIESVWPEVSNFTGESLTLILP